MNTFKIIIGSILVISPFVAFAVHIIQEHGWGAFFFIFGGTLLMTAILIGGILLIGGGIQ